jgi:hypothetical protein
MVYTQLLAIPAMIAISKTQHRLTSRLVEDRYLFQDNPSMILATKLILSSLIIYCSIDTVTAAQSITEALKETVISGDFNLRYEDVDNSVFDSDLLNLRSRLTLTSGNYRNFSAVVGVEDIRTVFGINDPFGLINDRDVTELDQTYVQYKTEKVTAKLGRQALALDNRRFIGTAPWRQDRRTLDALRIQIKPTQALSLDFSYVYKINQFPAKFNDRDANSVLFNSTYNTSIGKLTAYSYLLEDQTVESETDTYGLRFTGRTADNYALMYTVEYAQQTNQSFDAEYLLLETGLSAAGLTTKLGYERRGSDNGNYTFATPLANAHGYNGWSDIYTNAGRDGLTDLYLLLSGKIDRVALTARYHQFESDFGGIDKGSELDLLATFPIGDNVNFGMKYATFAQDDLTTPDDIDKFWLWLTLNF